MKERPILFSAPMVRAILEGRKTQTRRAVKPPPPSMEAVHTRTGTGFSLFTDHHSTPDLFRVGGPVSVVRDLCGQAEWRCPYGAPGDRLWVRETWRTEELAEEEEGEIPAGSDGVRFQADGGFQVIQDTQTASDVWVQQHNAPSSARGTKWRPSIHMPRWASRITLEVTGVRVERVRDISEEDAKAEGADGCVAGHGPVSEAELRADPGFWHPRFYRDGFADLWRSINGDESWDANPWVWVVEFRRLS
jgi:hypothetical protein